MARLMRWLGLLVAPCFLTSCLLVPARFVSSLDVRADRSFSFTYVGEVQLLKSSKPDGMSDAPPGQGGTDQSWNGGGEAALKDIAATKGAIATADDDTSDESAQLRRLATTLAGEYGFRSVRYIGNRKLAIDYRINGRLDHAFVFPFNPDGEILIPFLAIELRGKDRVRIKAPGFANDESASSMGGLGGMGGMAGGADGPGAALDGSFTLTTNAEIVSQNQEEGGQAQPDGSRKIVWTVNPNTRDAPMAVLKVNALR